MRYTGNGEGMTLLLLTDAESRLLRRALEAPHMSFDTQHAMLEAFNRGIQRGTDKMTEESKADWKARKK